MYDQMVSQQQYLITSQILQIVESSRQHITHTFTFLKEGEQSLALPHFSKQNRGFEMVPLENYSCGSSKEMAK